MRPTKLPWLLVCALAPGALHCSSGGDGAGAGGRDAGAADADAGDEPTGPTGPRRDGGPGSLQCEHPGRVIPPTLPPSEACSFRPPVGEFEPALQWQWHSSAAFPTYTQVIALPVVIDLDGDTLPEVVFTSYSLTTGPEFEAGGIVRALDGRDGTERWTAAEARARVSPQSGLAAGDLDGDGKPELVAIGVPSAYDAENDFLPTGTKLVALGNDGKVKWVSSEEVLAGWGSPTLADLDLDGKPEIVVGNTVFEHDGTLRWRGQLGTGGITLSQPARSQMGAISVVADLDGDGSPEIVAGNTLYGGDGAVVWQRRDLPDGLTAVANLDCDDDGEIVLVGESKVHVLDTDGSTLCGPTALPGGERNNRGGAPVIADFDGDGQLEFATAGSKFYTVFELDCTVKWSVPTKDESSNVSSSSVFDFEGDGSAEVVYNDEKFLRIYRGTDGKVLFEVENPSDTTFEYPLIVDVDGDFNAEIVVVANDRTKLTDPARRGVKVFADVADNWVGTRRVWNQHAYDVTHIADDGEVPARAPQNWTLHNNFRQNVPGANDPAFGAPDLAIFEPMSGRRVDPTRCPDQLTLRARVVNQGAVGVAAGVKVAVHWRARPPAAAPAPGSDWTLAGVVATTMPLRPGEGEDVELVWATPYAGGDLDLRLRVDDDGAGVGAHNECREDNNERVYEDLLCMYIP